MKRTIDFFLQEWKRQENHKPLLLRGARQVGKTHAARVLGKSFKNIVEINLEINEKARAIVTADYDPVRIVRQLSELLQTEIIPGKTLLFIDEIQNVPAAIIALRYFYEQMPGLHVIAAGSLLDFAIEQVGIPVGRVISLYMYPMSFLEFLVALGNNEWARLILEHSVNEPLTQAVHEKLLGLVGEYLAIGGMPEAVREWVKTKTSRSVKTVHADLIYTYQQDFGKYARQHQVKYLNQLFQKAIEQLSRKFMYSRVGEYQKRELQPALELLVKAGLLYPVVRSAGQGIPIGAQADLDDFKIIFLDVALCQILLKLDITPWFLEPLKTFVNKGGLVEAFVGQELLAYSDPIMKEELFYWKREHRGSHAEVDYLVQIKEAVVPLEVKAGMSERIKSMYMFFESHPQSSYGIRFTTHNYHVNENIHTYPLYAVAKPFVDVNLTIYNALKYLVSKDM